MENHAPINKMMKDSKAVDLRIKENKDKFILQELGEKLVNLMKMETVYNKYKSIEPIVAQLYSETDNIKYMEDNTFYMVDNLPTGKWNVICGGAVNWSRFGGEGGPTSYVVGTLDWNAKTGEYKLEGFNVCSELEYGVTEVKDQFNINNEDDVDYERDPEGYTKIGFLGRSEVLICWKGREGLMPAHSSQSDFHSSRVLQLALAQFISNEAEFEWESIEADKES